jgi:ribosome biogenesis GTPase / thiamine phosphate phosphatase
MSKNHYYHHEEEFHSKEDRKMHRKERKMASAKDRSKFKKSDQDQIKKRQPAPLSQEEKEGMRRGRVLAIRPEGIVVDSDDKLFFCSLKGSLKQDKNRIKNLVAVGDFVQFIPHQNQGSILLIEERTSILSRADNLSRNKEQLIAVNIDQVLITTSVVLPPLKTSLIDRYIIAARKGNMEPVIVVNKIDLLQNPPPQISSEDLEEEKRLYEEFIQIYQKLHIPIFPVSSATGEGIDALKKAMANKSSVFSGQSGVGKSSLINAALGTSFLVGEIVGKTQKGSHTTTASHLIPLEGGGFCIDTPGIKSFGLWELEKEEIQAYFSEILHYGRGCKYPDCSHLQEPDCAVQKAVEESHISPLRFASYCTLMKSLSEEHRHR